MKRLSSGGRIDRSLPITVKFDGRTLPAYTGDTLASAMLANGVSTVARSFKYHRPRGIYSAGFEEPNALVHLREGGRHEPNVRATTTEAFEGLHSTPQNAWPSLTYDIGAVNNLLSPFFSAGFYYKTFIGPFKGTKFWMFCEDIIRKSAGMGRGSYEPDPDTYEKRHIHCDLLIVGGGAAGLCAALSAGRAGANVILVEQDSTLGGQLLSEPVGSAQDLWLKDLVDQVTALENIRILTRTTAIGAYESDTFALIEQVSDHRLASENHQVRQRYWQVNAKRSVMATGAVERPLVFGGNDKPGVMLAGAVRTYLNRFAVLAGEHTVVCTNNDSAYSVAIDLAQAGSKVTLADLRSDGSPTLLSKARDAGVEVLTGHGVLAAEGRTKVEAALIAPVDAQGKATGPARKVQADLIAASAGWAPVVHLWSQLYRKPEYHADGACFIPTPDVDRAMQTAGTAVAAASMQEVVQGGFAQGAQAAKALGITGATGPAPTVPAIDGFWQHDLGATWLIQKQGGGCKGKAFVDLQHDVKLTDIDQAHLEGYVSVEHLKRYTTTGMATDQGKLSNINALSRMAELRGMEIPKVGTTTFRPPFTPTAIGAIVGHEHGHHFRPTRYTPIEQWHRDNGAHITEAGAWMRPFSYPKTGETPVAASFREAAHVRSKVGIIDVSTLGKIAVQGPDAAEFLNRIYVNGWKTLQIGRLRYGAMLREDGFVMDDGATARLGENDYFMSTTTANAAKVLAFAEKLLQTAWSDLRVHVTTITDQWAAFAIAGPNSRALLTDVTGGTVDLGKDAMPNNHFVYVDVAGVKCRLHRMSYSGELAYELYVPTGYAQMVWDALQTNGHAFDLAPYGTEAMAILRIEKGHVAGPELEGRTTLKDLGLEGFASSKKAFVGSVLRKRPVLEDPARPTLVGLEIVGNEGAKAGSILYADGADPTGHGDGWVSSVTYSPALGKNIALALLKNGKDRKGETVQVMNFVGDQKLTAKVVSHHFFDPKGERQNA